jgi:hypothetical protein
MFNKTYYDKVFNHVDEFQRLRPKIENILGEDIGSMSVPASMERLIEIIENNQSQRSELKEKTLNFFQGKHWEKPPLGLMPRKLWLEVRLVKVKEAITRFNEASKEIPLEWIEEYNHLVRELD